MFCNLIDWNRTQLVNLLLSTLFVYLLFDNLSMPECSGFVSTVKRLRCYIHSSSIYLIYNQEIVCHPACYFLANIEKNV